MAITNIAKGVPVTNFGQPPGADTVTNIAVPGTKVSSAAIGVPYKIDLTHDAQVAASASDEVIAAFQASGKMKILSISYWVRALTGTVSFDLYNLTDTAAIIANLTPTTTPQISTTFVSEALQVLEKDDDIQLRATTAGASTIDGLHVVLEVMNIEEAPQGVSTSL